MKPPQPAGLAFFASLFQRRVSALASKFRDGDVLPPLQAVVDTAP